MNNTLLKRIGIVIAALIPVAIVGAFVMKSDDNTSSTTTTASSTSPTTSNTAATSSSGSSAQGIAVGDTPTTTTIDTTPSVYADGTYTATGEYTAPDGPQSITVTLTVADDVITKVAVVNNAKENTASGMWQEKFASGVQTAVVGKSLVDLKLTKVSGSSLTPIGFNAAVAEIQTQAKG